MNRVRPGRQRHEHRRVRRDGRQRKCTDPGKRRGERAVAAPAGVRADRLAGGIEQRELRRGERSPNPELRQRRADATDEQRIRAVAADDEARRQCRDARAGKRAGGNIGQSRGGCARVGIVNFREGDAGRAVRSADQCAIRARGGERLEECGVGRARRQREGACRRKRVGERGAAAPGLSRVILP